MPIWNLRPWTGATPPFWDASIGIGEGVHVHAHGTLPRGSLPPLQSARKSLILLDY